jgi:hypothetical protein
MHPGEGEKIIIMNILEVSPIDYHSKLGLDRSNIFAPDSYLSKSRLFELANCSLYRWRFAPKEFSPTGAMSWGSLVDCFLLTPEEVAKTVVFSPYADYRSKAAQEFKKEIEASGRVLMKADEQDAINKAVSILKSDRLAGPIIENSNKQVILLNEIQGVKFKGLVDIAPIGADYLCDLKTTSDFSIRGFSNTTAKFGYHIQAGIYLKLWNLCNPDDQRRGFRFIWQDSSAPYEVAVTELPTADIEAGSEWAAFQLDRLIKATDENKWPNILGDKIAVIGRPTWATYADEEEFDGVVAAPNRKDN